MFFISLCVASVALARVFTPGLYSTACRATFPALYAVASSLFLLFVFSIHLFLFIVTMSFAGYFLVHSFLSAFPAYLRTYFRFNLVWFRLSCNHGGWVRNGPVNNVRKTTTTSGFLLDISLFTQAPILVWFDGTIIVHYYYPFNYVLLVQCLCFVMIGGSAW